MLSKANRFDYHPTSKEIPVSNYSKPQARKNLSATFTTTNEGMMEEIRVITPSLKNKYDNSSTDEGFQLSSTDETTKSNILSTAPNSSSLDEIHTDDESPFSTPRKCSTKSIVHVDVHYSLSEPSSPYSSKDDFFLGLDDDAEEEDVLDQSSEASGLSPPPSRTKLRKCLNDLEEKIDKPTSNILSTAPNSSSSDEIHTDEESPISTPRKCSSKSIVHEDVHYYSSSESLILYSSDDDLFLELEDDSQEEDFLDQSSEASGSSPPPFRTELRKTGERFIPSLRALSPRVRSFQERLEELEAMQRSCLMETLDFLKRRGNNEELVEFCCNEINNLSLKWNGEKEQKEEKVEKKKKKWSTTKKYFGRVFRPCGRNLGR